jgi:hypothetical protein
VVLGPAGYTPGEPVPAEVVAYFADEPAQLYQLRQWLPVFEQLDTRHRVLVATSDARTYAEVNAMTGLRCVLAPANRDLVELYDSGDYKVAVYVNNSMLNFLSLSARRMLHVHLNHGESDKFCMASNQVKAYDRRPVDRNSTCDGPQLCRRPAGGPCFTPRPGRTTPSRTTTPPWPGMVRRS